jgi:dihydrofolate reductase
MRKIIYLVHTSVDGFIEGPAGEFDWPVVGPELSAYVKEFEERTDLFLYGRVVWEMMAGFWPRAEELSDDPHTRSFAPVWRRTPKAVVSRTLAEPAGDDVTVLRGVDLAAEVTALKDAPGKDILLTGGTELASQLAALGLIDEYFICVHPVVLGGGRRLFLHQKERTGLELAEARTADGRVVVLRYLKA